MTKFVEITKINSYKETGKALVRVSDIVGIKQKHVESEKLYNENGDLVSETPATEKDFQILVADQMGHVEKYHVNETEYNRLVKLLTTETE